MSQRGARHLLAMVALALVCVQLRQPVTAQPISTWAFGIIGFNVRTTPFDKPLVRRALATAVNARRVALTMSAVSLDLSAMAATSIVPPGCIGFDPATRAHAFDARRAGELLAESGFTPERLGVIELVSGRRVETEGLVRELQSALPIRVVIRESADVRTAASRAKMWYLVGVTDNCVNANVLQQFVHSKGSTNLSGYADPETDAALDRARESSDPETRGRLYAEIERRILNDAVLVPVWWRFPERRYTVDRSVAVGGVTLRPREVEMGMTWTQVEVTLDNGTASEVEIFGAVLNATLTDEYNRSFGSDPSPPKVLPETIAPRSSVTGTIYFRPAAATTRRLLLTVPEVRVGGERVTMQIDISPP